MPSDSKQRESPLQTSSPMAEAKRGSKPVKRSHKSKRQAYMKAEKPPTLRAFRSFFSCKDYRVVEGNKRKCKRIVCSGSLCSLKGSSGVVRPEATSPEVYKKMASSRWLKAPPNETNRAVSNSSYSFNSSASITAPSSSSSSLSSSSSSLGGSFRGKHLRRFSGCYECHVAVDPVNGVSRAPSMRATICPCPDCGEIFMKPETLELHQAVRHAVSELGPDDTSRNIVEIIFQSSWLKKEPPVCKIDRILKVRSTQKTIAEFEIYRDSIKSRANKVAKKHPRCIADGNELLRFHCTTFACSLGLSGSTNLCQSAPQCNVCSIIRDGFKMDSLGKIQTMATSGRAHDMARIASGDAKRAMLVCRVIAGRVKKSQDALEECDSVANQAGVVYSNLDELFVFDPKAILPCFVVVYSDY
ncbi:uncharacterized protein LOC103701262 [Phoenix dactylifera]|uniref:Uncharacterized protein LOC103701262 n=1 Tax=Phoenix dactylifera TaxID=42345 RepID=A0A8B7BMM7_PHODC|nr:uncharacterized protein LOC103701262 [Phoenix dactylifera]